MTNRTDTRRRAILTDNEREKIQTPTEDRDTPNYVAISHARRKIREELPKDLEILRENHRELYDELVNVVRSDMG